MDAQVTGRATRLLLASALTFPGALFAENVLEFVRTNSCDIRVIRDNAVTNDRYFWAGECADGRAHGPGWLFRYYVDASGRAYQPDRVWEINAYAGAMGGSVRYRAGWYWTWWGAGDPAKPSQPARVFPRHMLNADMQKALNQAAAAIKAHGIVPMPVQQYRVMCPKEIEVAAANGKKISFNVHGYISSKKTFDAARRELAASLVQPADSVDPGSLRLIASAVVGCQLSITR